MRWSLATLDSPPIPLFKPFLSTYQSYEAVQYLVGTRRISFLSRRLVCSGTKRNLQPWQKKLCKLATSSSQPEKTYSMSATYSSSSSKVQHSFITLRYAEENPRSAEGAISCIHLYPKMFFRVVITFLWSGKLSLPVQREHVRAVPLFSPGGFSLISHRIPSQWPEMLVGAADQGKPTISMLSIIP